MRSSECWLTDVATREGKEAICTTFVVQTHAQTHTPSLSLSLTHTHTPSFSLSHTHTWTQVHAACVPAKRETEREIESGCLSLWPLVSLKSSTVDSIFPPAWLQLNLLHSTTYYTRCSHFFQIKIEFHSAASRTNSDSVLFFPKITCFKSSKWIILYKEIKHFAYEIAERN